MAFGDIAKLLASLDLDTKPFERGAARVSGDLGKIESRVGKTGVKTIALGTALGGALDRLASKGIDALFGSIRAASDLSETVSKVGVVFGPAADQVLKFGENASTSIGLSAQKAEEAAGTFGNLFTAMGLGQPKAAEMSTSLVTLAGDLASFNNIDPTEALEKLRSGLTGETEPLKSLGININENILKAKALELGLVKTGVSTADLKLRTKALSAAHKDAVEAIKKYGAGSKQALAAIVKEEAAQKKVDDATKKFPGTLDAATKAQAAYALIFDQSTAAQGDFARTSGGLANQQRILRANLDNTAATLGGALLPKVTELVKKVNEFLTHDKGAVEAFGTALAAGFDAVFGVIEAVPWSAVADAFSVMGTGAKAIVSAFTSLPPWIQTAVITGWGLNKLSGGAGFKIGVDILGGGVQKLLGGLFQRGSSPANPMFVTGTGLGGGAPVPGAGGGIGAVGKLFLIGEAIGLIAAVNEVRDNISTAATKQAQGLQETLNQSLASPQTVDELNTKLAGIDQGIARLKADPLAVALVTGPALETLESMRSQVVARLDTLNKNTSGSPDDRDEADRAKQTQQKVDNLRDAVEAARNAMVAKEGQTAQNVAQTRDRIEAARNAMVAAEHQTATRQVVSTDTAADRIVRALYATRANISIRWQASDPLQVSYGGNFVRKHEQTKFGGGA